MTHILGRLITWVAGLLIPTTVASVVGVAALAGTAYYVVNNTDLLNNTVKPPSQYEGKRAEFVAAPAEQHAVNFGQPMKPASDRSDRGSDGFVLKRTHQAIREGRLSDGQAIQRIASAPRVQMVHEERRPVKKGEALEILVKQYMDAFNSAAQVLPSDQVKVDEFARNKAAIFDQIAAIVFPVPNQPANAQAVAYIRTREKDDRKAIGDLLGSIEFLQEAAKTAN